MRVARLVKDGCGEEAKVRNGARDIEFSGQRKRLAVVDRLGAREFVDIFFNQTGEFQKEIAPLRCRCSRPGWKRGSCSVDGIINIALVAIRNLGHHLGGGWIDVVKVRG